jgi:hypothetical protein
MDILSNWHIQVSSSFDFPPFLSIETRSTSFLVLRNVSLHDMVSFIEASVYRYVIWLCQQAQYSYIALLLCNALMNVLSLFCSFLSLVCAYIKRVLCVIWTQLDDGVVELTSYTEDSGNATPPVCHCDYNKIKAAAVTKYSLYPSKFVTNIPF